MLATLTIATVLARVPAGPQVYIFPYFTHNGETGLYLAASTDGLTFANLNDAKPVLESPPWPHANLIRDPSILQRGDTFHLVWTTGWQSPTIGYATSTDLIHWSQPRQIELWPKPSLVKNTWAPELFFDEAAGEFLILWSSTTLEELNDADNSEDPHGYDHRIYASRTADFVTFTPPALFYAPDPEHGVIDAFIATDDRNTPDPADDRFVMVLKNEMDPLAGGKNLRLVFSDRLADFPTTLGPPIAGAGTTIVDRMVEGPTLLKADGQWRLYFDAPGAALPYGLATSTDLIHWTDRSAEIHMPIDAPRHGTIFRVPATMMPATAPHS